MRRLSAAVGSTCPGRGNWGLPSCWGTSRRHGCATQARGEATPRAVSVRSSRFEAAAEGPFFRQLHGLHVPCRWAVQCFESRLERHLTSRRLCERRCVPFSGKLVPFFPPV